MSLLRSDSGVDSPMCAPRVSAVCKFMTSRGLKYYATSRQPKGEASQNGYIEIPRVLLSHLNPFYRSH
jgi:hypothetical protein